MGKFLEKFKGAVNNVDKKLNDHVNKEKIPQFENKKIVVQPKIPTGGFPADYFDPMYDGYLPNTLFDELGNPIQNNPYSDVVSVRQSQKPESFHHFILENEYRDLEMSIRGYKDVYNKETKEWETKRKESHCFTDEESEEILRTAQSHLSTDIKLSYVNKEAYSLLMDAIYKTIEFLFESIAEYRYGRYGDEHVQYKMKLQNLKIFLELFTRIQANYSRAIQGQESRLTHDSVQGQESLQQLDRDPRKFRKYT